MIDQDKMRALAAKLRDPAQKWANLTSDANQAANAIDLLLAEVEAIDKSSTACCDSYAVENQRLSDEIDKLRAELEAAAADKRDAERYRILRRGQRWSVINWVGETLRADRLDAVIDASLAQRQGEGS